MTTNAKQSGPDLRAMSRVPMDPSWIASLPAFEMEEGGIVTAALKLLLAAWHQVPAGCVQHNPAALASLCGISEQKARQWRAILMAGWDVRGEMMIFPPMEKIATRMHKHYRQHIEALEDGMGLSACAPDLFEGKLIPQEDQTSAMTSRLTGRRKLPEGAGLTTELRNFLLKGGFAAAQHDDIWASFEDYVKSKDVRSNEWESAFRNWARQNTTWGHIVPQARTVNPAQAARPHVRLASVANKSDNVTQGALDSLNRVSQRVG